MVSIDLSGKVAVVTGGSGELGRVMVRTLARAGADVAIHYHKNEKQAKKLHVEIEALGVRGMTVQADVTRLDSVMDMCARIGDKLGDPDILVNNAVIQFTWRHVIEQPVEDFEGQFRSSVLHNVFMAKAFVPAMIRRKWGRVIGINTECVMRADRFMAAYASGKRGMDAVLRSLARDVGEHGITVNQIAPGWMLSENRPDRKTTEEEGYRKSVALQRRGTDQEVANVVAFLASDLASFITGAFIPVSGGNVMLGV